MYEDPLYKMRHALLGLGAALTLSVLLAAAVGATIGDMVTGTYTGRVSFYGGILLYVIVGAVVVFMKVARHETKPVSVQRVLLWTLCLWAWPGVLVLLRGGRNAEVEASIDSKPSREGVDTSESPAEKRK